jgi:hypothetical protein
LVYDYSFGIGILFLEEKEAFTAFISRIEMKMLIDHYQVHTNTHTHTHTHTHSYIIHACILIMHSMDPELSQGDNRMWNT